MASKKSLLSLPQEVQDEIWTHLLGNLEIHIGYNDGIPQAWKKKRAKRGLYYFLSSGITEPYCMTYPSANHDQKPTIWKSGYRVRTGKEPSDRARRNWVRKVRDFLAGTRSPSVLSFRDASFSPLEMNENTKLAPLFQARLPLAILRVCKKVHDDATEVLYSRNEFYFEEYARSSDAFPPQSSLSRFADCLSPRQRGLVRKLHLCIPAFSLVATPPDILWYWEVDYLNGLFDKENAALPAFENLQLLSLDHLRGCDMLRLIREDQARGVPIRIDLAKTRGYGCLQPLRLKKLQIAVWDGTSSDARFDRRWGSSFGTQVWTREGRTRFERGYRAYLLGKKAAQLRN